MKENFDAFGQSGEKLNSRPVRNFKVCYEETLKKQSGRYFRYFGGTPTTNDILRILTPALWKKICLESFFDKK